MRLRTILSLALLVTATAAIAADDPIHQLDILGGKWQCKGTAYAFADMPEHPIVATTNGTWILGKSWLEIEYREMKNAKNKMPYNVDGFFSYDAEIKKFVLGSVASDRSYSVEQSDGWSGDTIVFTGPNHMGGMMTMTGRDTWTKSGKKLSYMFEIDDHGTWKKLIEETCTR